MVRAEAGVPDTVRRAGFCVSWTRVADGIDTGDRDPPEIQLHRDQRRIGLLDQNIHGVPGAVGELFELARVIVDQHLHAELLRYPAMRVQLRGAAL